MTRAHISRFAVRDRGQRRVRTVTIWSATGSAGLAVATAIALVPATASPASSRAVTSVPGTTGAVPAASPTGAATPEDAPATRRPRPRHTTSAPRLVPPTTPPVVVHNPPPQTGSGGS